jgi:uncharacterized protein YodC (DUF2158 family)
LVDKNVKYQEWRKIVNIKEGDTVRLKSGSPSMTVEKITSDGFVSCVWFVEHKVNRDAFRPSALELYDDSPIPPIVG